MDDGDDGVGLAGEGEELGQERVAEGRAVVERGDDVVTVRDTRRGGNEQRSAPDLIALLNDEVASKRPT